MRIIDKIFGDKKGNSVIYIILAVGILMLIGSSSLLHNDSAQINVAEPEANLSLKGETEGILSEIKGVGNVSVMIAYEGESEKSSVIDMGEASHSRRIKSVLVVADGGDGAMVREKIVRALTAALGVEPHKIEVFERKEEQ